MNDRFKRVFAGKPLTQTQIVNWERTRAKGRTMYVAWVALWWGTMMVVMFSIGLHYLNGAPFDARIILLNALIFYPLGFLLGFANWSGKEKKYHERFNAK